MAGSLFSKTTHRTNLAALPVKTDKPRLSRAAFGAAAAALLLMTGFSGVARAEEGSADESTGIMLELTGTLEGPDCTLSDVPGMVVWSDADSQVLVQVRVGDPTMGGFAAYDVGGKILGSVWGPRCDTLEASDSSGAPVIRITELNVDPIECPLSWEGDASILSVTVVAEAAVGVVAPVPTEYTYVPTSGSCVSLPDVQDKIASGGTHPDRVWIKERYPITSFVKNLDSVPHLVGVEVYPNAENICSVASEVSSTGTQVREREFLLFAEGTEEQLNPLGQVIQLGDQISISTHVVTTSVGGTCDVNLVYTIDAVFWGLMQFSTQVVIPPPVADLGAVAASTGCATGEATGTENPASVTVQAGTIDVFADLDFAKQCNRHRVMGTLLIEKQVDNEWVPVGAAVTSETGIVRGIGQDNVVEGGPYKYRVTGKALTITITWGCIIALLALGISVLALVFGGGVLAWIALVLSIAGLLASCFGVDAEFSFEVLVTAVDPESFAAVNLRGASEVADSIISTR